MVANNRSDSSNKERICLSTFFPRWFMSFISLGDNEKKAISDAETKPEHPNNKTAKTKATMAPALGAYNVIPSKRLANWHKYESGSNDYRFSSTNVFIYLSFASSTFWSSGVQKFSLRSGVTDNSFEPHVKYSRNYRLNSCNF